VRGVQAIVRVGEATVTFDLRTRIVERVRRLRVHWTCIAGVRVVMLVVDGVRLRDARCGKGEYDQHCLLPF
jgi:hypothetical protein